MIFSSLLFLLIYLPVTVILYYLLPEKGKNILLLVVSLIFYAWGEPGHIILMLITTIYIWALTIVMEKFMLQGNMGAARFLMILCVALSLGTLAFYKYFGFFIDNLPFLQNLGLESIRPALPVGISFYTFQALSYVIDVYRRDVKAQKNWANFAMYISFFPQLIAGPIIRYTDIVGQLKNRRHTLKNITKGIVRFTFGLGKKVLLANQIGMIWDEISALGELTVVSAWIGAIAFTFQIYFDFSAYSDMAIGLGKMFGFEFTENFRYPYQSKSVSEFWNRWHITLSTWFKEYVYIPLGGNRKGKVRQVFNLFVVWSLTGFWHGADWQFLFWGLYYFLFLVFEKFLFIKVLDKCPNFLRSIYTCFVVILGWVVFASENIESAFDFYKAMFGIGVSFLDETALFYLMTNIILLIVLTIGSTDLPKRLVFALGKCMKSSRMEVLIYCSVFVVLWVSIAFLTADSYNPFLYFRF